jgi:phospholipase/carboxylesterase
VAFSPGFQAADRRRGRPEVFLTHGIHDGVLPVERTSRTLVRALRRDGLEVVYREFSGPHVVPPELAHEAAAWVVR